MLSCVSPHFLLLVKKLFSSFERMDGLAQQNNTSLSRNMQRRKSGCDKFKQGVKSERILVDGEILSYMPDDAETVGVFLAAQPLSPDHNYFEIELLDTGMFVTVTVGLAPLHHPLDKQPGIVADSFGYYADDGHLYKGNAKGTSFGPKFKIGDRIGCGIKFEHFTDQNHQKPLLPVFFTKNGKEVGSIMAPWPSSGFYPAVSLHSPGEEIKLVTDIKWITGEDVFMSVDDDEWSRLHDVRLNGQVLEYTGRGKRIIDVGLAQARWPLNTTCHYFEIEILDPGENCYIAIGLTKRDYPRRSHPGWNKGSIAYHADDGKIFVGDGVGDPFGPRCHKGDIMGCGIIFPNDYVGCTYNGIDLSPGSPIDMDAIPTFDGFESPESDLDDDKWWENPKILDSNVKVKVFFTRNGKTLGQKEICIPKGGFYPTVGMLSHAEKVKVDLCPLSG